MRKATGNDGIELKEHDVVKIFKDGKEILNSWFCGVYPISQPKYAIAVLCDVNSRKNNVKAVFKQICEFIYSGESDYPYNP